MSQSMQQSMWCKATLQYPTVNQLPLESVGDMLNKASNLATTANFQWSYIDRPADGSIFLVYIQNGTPAPPDGYMYMDSEQPYTMNAGGKMIEIWEHKYGFLPGQEQVTSRSRRRFRLAGKNPNDVASSLWLLFYSRTSEDARVQANPMQAQPQPVRKYPLPAVTTKPFNLFQAVTGGAQIPNHQQQMQQQYQMQQQQQQMQAQQSQQQNQQRQIRSQTPQQQQQQQQRPTHTPHVSQTAVPSSLPAYTTTTATATTPAPQVPQKRAYPGATPSATPQLPPEVAARVQRGEVVTEPFDDPIGDEFDAIHPIDLSRSRFTRHQNWLEQIFSAYSTAQIVSPACLPDDITEDSLNARIEAEQDEMERLRVSHAAKLERFRNPEGLPGRIKAGLARLSAPPLVAVSDDDDAVTSDPVAPTAAAAAQDHAHVNGNGIANGIANGNGNGNGSDETGTVGRQRQIDKDQTSTMIAEVESDVGVTMTPWSRVRTVDINLSV